MSNKIYYNKSNERLTIDSSSIELSGNIYLKKIFDNDGDYGVSGQILQIDANNDLKWIYLPTIQGAQGTSGEQGVGIKEISYNDPNLTFTLTDGSSITIENVKGEQGDPGPYGIVGVDLSLSYLDVSNIANINYLIVNNDLTVKGTTYTVHHQDITISDETITLASNLTNSDLLTQSNYAGIEISNIAYLKYYDSKWEFDNNLNISGGYLKVNDVDVATINSNNLINYTISSELYSKDELKSGNLDLSFQNIDISGYLKVNDIIVATINSNNLINYTISSELYSKDELKSGNLDLSFQNIDISGYLKVNDISVATINSNNLINYTISSELYSKDELKSGILDLSFNNVDISNVANINNLNVNNDLIVNGNSVFRKRISQILNDDISFSHINGYYALSKDVAPKVSNKIADNLINNFTWNTITGHTIIITVAWSPELNIFVCAGSGGYSYSYDGIHWSDKATISNIDIIFSIAWSAELGMFVAVGYQGKHSYSYDGISWESASTITDINTMYCVIWSYELRKFIAVGDAGKYTYSIDGINWSNGVTINGIINGIQKIIWSAELGKFIVLSNNGSNGILSYSYDGINWSDTYSVTKRYSNGIWSKELGKFVIFSNDSYYSYSYDGINWSDESFLNGFTNVYSIVWSAEIGKIVIVGDSGKYSYSSDGITWKTTSSISGFNSHIRYIVWSPELGKLVGVGHDGKHVYTNPIYILPTTKNIFQNSILYDVSINNNLDVSGNISISNELIVDGITNITNSSNSTTTSNGSLVVSGGVGINKNLNVGGSIKSNNLDVTGSLNINGNLDLSGNLFPRIDSSYNLGSSSNRWKNIYSNNLDISGSGISASNSILANGVSSSNSILANGVSSSNSILANGLSSSNSILANGQLSSNTIKAVTGSYGNQIIAEGTASNTIKSDAINNIEAIITNITGNLDLSGNLFPRIDSSYNLGSSSNRWKNIYSNNLDISGSGISASNSILANGLSSSNSILANGPLSSNSILANGPSSSNIIKAVTGSYGNQIIAEGTAINTIKSAVINHIEAIITNISGNLIPTSNQQYDLGSSSFNWGSVHCNKIYCNEIISTSDNNTWIKFINESGGYRIKASGLEEYPSSTGYRDGYLITYQGSSWTGYLISDDRLKHNEENIISSLDLIRKLQPQTYDMTQDFKDADFSGTISGEYIHRAGFIAQEIRSIEEISYCCVGQEYDSSGNPTSLAIDYNSIFTHGIAAIKELHSIVESLQSENTLLKNKLNEVLTEMGKDPI